MTDSTLRLEGELTINEAQAQHERLLAWLMALPAAPGDGGDPGADAASADAGDAPALDLSAVSACDSAGVQLLLATRASLAGRGQRLRFGAVSPVVDEVLGRFGLRSLA